MGLDMYLYAERYVSAYEWKDAGEKKAYETISEATGLGSLVAKEHPSLTVKVCVGYWRKANAIHSWFVQNVQGGRDECQPSECHREQLAELQTLCKQALDAFRRGNYAEAGNILTPKEGFFFGSTDVDEWYARDLEHTIKTLDPLLAPDCPAEWFIYQSSW